ncbi:hypothetical protein [Nesterenkonia ebinurensis]|uniref:hypothetical protein n=1 Tax=Nesterenkonia ebinurensis TaxID=2608252 RepID=UPI00123E19D8|nr:hypothetical protein [Nesterenkonia ebinurensis]
MVRWAAAVAISLLALGCARAGEPDRSPAPRSGPPAQLSITPETVEGPPANTYGTLRAMQIRSLLLNEQELFPRTPGEVVEYVEAETVLHRWQQVLVPEEQEEYTAAALCTRALGDVYAATQESPLISLMFVRGHRHTGGEHPAEVAVGIASYHQPAQVQQHWEAAAAACDSVVLPLDEHEYQLSAVRHAGAVGLSFRAESAEHHILGLDNGHNALTVYTETSAEHAAALLERQRAKLGISP